MTSNATYKRTISADLPDYGSDSVTFHLLSEIAIADSETFPKKVYTLTLDANGEGTIDLPTPDNTGSASWLWLIVLPDDNKQQATLAYAGSALPLAAWLASASSSTTANSIADQFVAVAGDTMTGALTLSGDPTNALHAATKQYVDAIPDTSEYIILAVSDETTDLTTGTAKVAFRMPYALTLSDVRASVTTAPAGSAIQVDINESGTTILSTKLTIDAGEKTSETAATPAVISDSALADDAEITVDIDAVGSSTAGAGLKVYLIGAR